MIAFRGLNGFGNEHCGWGWMMWVGWDMDEELGMYGWSCRYGLRYNIPFEMKRYVKMGGLRPLPTMF